MSNSCEGWSLASDKLQLSRAAASSSGDEEEARHVCHLRINPENNGQNETNNLTVSKVCSPWCRKVTILKCQEGRALLVYVTAGNTDVFMEQTQTQRQEKPTKV